MNRVMAVCLAALLSFNFVSCSMGEKNSTNATNPTNIEQGKEQIDISKYVGQYYIMGQSKEADNEEAIELNQVLPEDSYTLEELGINTKLCCIEIKETQDVDICIQGRAKESAKLISKDNKVYVKLNKKIFDNYSDEILLGKAEVNNINYITFESGKDKNVYLEKLENKKVISTLKVNDDGTFEALGEFYIDGEIIYQVTGESPDIYWGLGFNKYGTSMTINEDNTGKYIIGVADFNEFKIIKEDGKTYMEVINKDTGVFDEAGTRYLMDIKEVNGEKYIYVDKGIGQYWKVIDEETSVFSIPGKGEFYWDIMHFGSEHM